MCISATVYFCKLDRYGAEAVSKQTVHNGQSWPPSAPILDS